MKKMIVSLLALTFSVVGLANDLYLKDYNYNITDVLENFVTKEAIFKQMDKEYIQLGKSICANRAHLWSFDFKRKYDVDAAKIFLFYTEKSGSYGATNWWYHVAPVIGEKGKLYVMDAAFPKSIKGPITKDQWLKRFARTTKCYAIQPDDEDLIKRMFRSAFFPQTTSRGSFDCYYKIVPAGFWFPASVAMGLLQQNEDGEPINYSREEIKRQEVYQACVEAATSKFGRMLGSGKKKCKQYLEL